MLIIKKTTLKNINIALKSEIIRTMMRKICIILLMPIHSLTEKQKILFQV